MKFVFEYSPNGFAVALGLELRSSNRFFDGRSQQFPSLAPTGDNINIDLFGHAFLTQVSPCPDGAVNVSIERGLRVIRRSEVHEARETV